MTIVETHKILFESLEKAERLFEAGEIRNGQKLVNEVSRSIRSEGKVSNKLRHRFNFMSAHSQGTSMIFRLLQLTLKEMKLLMR